MEEMEFGSVYMGLRGSLLVQEMVHLFFLEGHEYHMFFFAISHISSP